MPKRERGYRVVVEGPLPEDLAERCAAVWRDIRLAAEHAVVAARRVQEAKAPGGAEKRSSPPARRSRSSSRPTSRSRKLSSTLERTNGKP